MKKIGVISDTHGLLRPEVKEGLKDCDAILHAGDINRPELLDELREIAPVRAVSGNADEAWAEIEGLEPTARLTLFGLEIAMAHTKKAARPVVAGSDIIITGHTHKYEEKEADGQLWLNPGTCGPVRRSSPITMAVIATEEDGSYQVEQIIIPHPEEKKSSDKKSSAKKDADKKSTKKTTRKKKSKEDVTTDLIAEVIRGVNTGIPVPQIAENLDISEDLAGEISLLYVNNQGIDAEGILKKMS